MVKNTKYFFDINTNLPVSKNKNLARKQKYIVP